MSLPSIQITGGVCSEVELRFTPAGKAVANFRVAANDRKKTEAGGWVDGDSCYLTVNVWEQKAEACAEMLQKGSKVVVTGKLRQRDYEDREGAKRSVYEVQAYDVALVVALPKAEREKPTMPPQEDPWATSATTRIPHPLHRGDSMTTQLELPLNRSTPAYPFAEQDRTHPAQMILRHCGSAKPHVAHACDDGMPWGCPGVPDIREAP